MKKTKEEVEVTVNEINPFANDKFTGFTFRWSGNIGWGEYTIYMDAQDETKWYGESEHMDTNNDKWFIKKLLESFIEQLDVKE